MKTIQKLVNQLQGYRLLNKKLKLLKKEYAISLYKREQLNRETADLCDKIIDICNNSEYTHGYFMELFAVLQKQNNDEMRWQYEQKAT